MWFWEGAENCAEGEKTVEHVLDFSWICYFCGNGSLAQCQGQVEALGCYDARWWNLGETTVSYFSSNPYTVVFLVLVEHPLCPMRLCPTFGIMLKLLKLKEFLFCRHYEVKILHWKCRPSSAREITGLYFLLLYLNMHYLFGVTN